MTRDVLAPWLVLSGLVLAAHACGGEDRDLSVTDAATSATATTSGTGGSGGSSQVTVSSSSTGSIVEPMLPEKLTLVGGIVDAATTRYCALPYPSGASTAGPWPSGGLDFAHAAVADPLDSFIPTGTDVEIFVVVGDPGTSDCTALRDAPPTDVAVESLGVLPAQVFTEGKSVLVVSHGCIGGDDHIHETFEQGICGEGYKADEPTASMAAGFMSRLDVGDAIPMQFVHGAQGMGEVSLRLLPGQEAASFIQVVGDWTLGTFGPFPPYGNVSTLQLGDLAQAQLGVFSGGTNVHAQTIASMFDGSPLAAGDVADGSGLVFVAVGASPSVGEGSWWNPLAYVAVAADP